MSLIRHLYIPREHYEETLKNERKYEKLLGVLIKRSKHLMFSRQNNLTSTNTVVDRLFPERYFFTIFGI